MGEVKSIYRKGDVVYVRVGKAMMRFVVISTRIENGRQTILGANNVMSARFPADAIYKRGGSVLEDLPEAS